MKERVQQEWVSYPEAERYSGLGQEVRDIKAEIRQLIADVKAGELDRNDASVMVRAYRALKDYVELERRVKETDQLAEQVEELMERTQAS